VIDHVALEVTDLARSARFYDAVVHALGGRRVVSRAEGIGYGRDHPELWILPGGDERRPPGGGHLALTAVGRRAVDAAHEAGLAAGGRDGGEPAPRSYGPPSYYSGYLVDPDGAYVELVSGGR
jgi:catechol 2,3-dioxygenase-like lactoylglutathione lyase family enzyme